MVLPNGKLVKIPPREPLTALEDLVAMAPMAATLRSHQNQRVAGKIASVEKGMRSEIESSMKELAQNLATMGSTLRAGEKKGIPEWAETQTVAAIVIVGGVTFDGGGFIISDGKVIPVPPYNPVIMTELTKRLLLTPHAQVDLEDLVDAKHATIAVVV